MIRWEVEMGCEDAVVHVPANRPTRQGRYEHDEKHIDPALAIPTLTSILASTPLADLYQVVHTIADRARHLGR